MKSPLNYDPARRVYRGDRLPGGFPRELAVGSKVTSRNPNIPMGYATLLQRRHTVAAEERLAAAFAMR
jgi:hypothetical protein